MPPKYVPQLPEGWVKCPRFGDPRFFEGLNIIPCKVPLSRRFDQQVGASGRWTLADAIRQFRGYGMEVATVIDLTKSRNYYDFRAEMDDLASDQRGYMPDINYIKVECRGRGQAPQPSEVNQAVWHIFAHTMDPATADKYILLHCTHGFNRTGYIIVSALLRLRSDRIFNVRRALQRFAESRPPGIYKDHYINDLYKYYHTARDPRLVTPPVPRWKGNDDADDAADAQNEAAGEEDGAGEDGNAAAAAVIHHEDIASIGEPVCEPEADFIREQVCRLLPLDGGRGGRPRFPGMQPVSLSLDRLKDLSNHRYWVTWKADGTRYMVLILSQGTYIMDRSFNVVRCQMRFPFAVKHQPQKGKLLYPVGKPHHLTVLDGEMVVDVDPNGTEPPRLRYLIYDVCMINSTPLLDKPWKDRYRAIQCDLVGPRSLERTYIDDWGHKRHDPNLAPYQTPPLSYDYKAERFSVRQKPFWPVWQIDKVFARFNDPNKVGHESDGLILQGYEHPYNPGTCELLYKWKFAHMNSVDFLLEVGAPGPEPLRLMLLDQVRSRGGNVRMVPLSEIDPDGHYRVEFPPDVDPAAYDRKLVECTFDRDRGVWLFMRERRDKDTPNGSKVYLRIKESIINHVDEDLLVGTLKDAMLSQSCYQNDLAALKAADPGLLAVLQREVDEWAERMQALEEQRRAAKRQRLNGPSARPPQGLPGRYPSDTNLHLQPDFDPDSCLRHNFPPGEPASPPPADFLDGFGGGGYEGVGDGDAGGGDAGGGEVAYRVSDADPDAYVGVSREGEGGQWDGEGEGRPRVRITKWPPSIDEPHPACPAYEGYGFG